MRLNEREILILNYLKDHPRATTQQIATATGITYDRAQNRLGALYSRRLVGRQSSLMGGKPSLWTVGEPVKP